ncbi:MAG: class I SAM-dependent methyltransferase [Lysobacterales bacterium]|jgi:SAM-dependent methyltransferase
MSESLPFTGERFMPGLAGEIGYEHWHRYVVARRFCEGKKVLDVACGEGYGSDMLAAVAAHVTGVDVSGDAVAHATGHYGGRDNLRFIQGDCENLPLPDDGVDVAVSLETIEHIEAQEAFVGELRRVLRPGGLLVMSSPNKAQYTDARDYHNEFHVREMYRDEFEQLLQADFPHIHWLNQKLLFQSVIWPEKSGFDETEYFLMGPEGVRPADGPGVEAMYYLVACSDRQEALAGIENRLSLLGDESESVYTDYVYVTKRSMQLDAREQQLAGLEGKLVELEGLLSALQQQLQNQAGFTWWLKAPWRSLQRLLRR